MLDRYDIVLGKEDALLIGQCLAHYVEDARVRLALLLSRDGTVLMRQGDDAGVQVESLGALAVGTFTSSEALAQLAGEDSFNAVFHQGSSSNIFITLIGDAHLLFTLFDASSSAPLVRLQAKVTAETIADMLEKARAKSRATRAG